MTAVTTLPERATSVELYSGLGGLAMGLHGATLQNLLLVESNPSAAATLASGPVTGEMPLFDGDVREIDWADAVSSRVGLLAAGVPCQPFSQGGAHAGPDDERNMFPATFAAIRALRPHAVLVENVRGLARPAFQAFLDYLLDYLKVPHVAEKPAESWPDHHLRIRRHLAARPDDPDRYEVWCQPINVADYGVAQRRVRVIIVAVHHSRAEGFVWPAPTHAHQALLRDQLDGFYWDQHDLAPRSPRLAKATRRRLERWPHPQPLARWRTLRDVIHDLPTPSPLGETSDPGWHNLWPGARLYRGHRGSELDAPSKTIKAGVHGVAGGEHIVHLDDGTYRYLTVRECMRIQDLPDDLEIDHPRTVAMRQIGNAVPPTIGRVFGAALVPCVWDAERVPRAQSVAQQDAAAGGYVRRLAEIDGERVTGSISLNKGYANLRWSRPAGPAIYLGKVQGATRGEQLEHGWRLAHARHPELFIDADIAA